MDGEVIIKVSADAKDFDRKLSELERKYKNKEIDIQATEYNLDKQQKALEFMEKDAERLDNKYGEINKKIKEQTALLEKIKSTPRDYTTHEGRVEDYRLRNEMYALTSQRDASIRNQGKILSEITKQNELIDEQELKVNKLNARYEKQKNDLEQIAEKMQEIGMKTDETVHSSDKISNSSNKTIKSLLKWGLAIFSIRSAYSLLRQITSNVLSQNQKLGDQMDGLKKSFANAFTPVIEKIINLVKTLMAYINYVWKTLFGKELFSSKVAKDLKSGASSAKEINKQLAGFDEANVLSDNKSGGGGGAGGDTTDIGLANIKIPQWLVDITQWIKDNPTWAKIIFGLAGFTLFGGWKLASGIFGTISSLLGAGAGVGATGLIGVLGTLALIAGTVWTVTIAYGKVKEFIKTMNEVSEAHRQENELVESALKNDDELIKKGTDVLKSQQATDEQRKKAINLVKTMNEAETKNIKNKDLGTEKNIAYTKQLYKTAEGMDELYRTGKLKDDEEYEYFKMLANEYHPLMEDNIALVTGQQKEADKLRASYEKLSKRYSAQFVVEASSTGLIDVKNKVTDIVDKINAIKGNLFSKVSSVFHADGGIINYPGRGVPIDIGGEAGREGVIPMDNAQQMEVLGQAIAKYVRIDNYVSNYMDARKVNTILKQSEQQERLASNG